MVRSEGNWAPFSGLEATFRTSGENDWDSYKTSAGTILSFARGPERTARGSWMLYFTMLLFSGLLALDAAYPLALFRWQHMCDVKDPSRRTSIWECSGRAGAFIRFCCSSGTTSPCGCCRSRLKTG